MIKFIGAVMIFFAASAFGMYLSNDIKRKIIRLETERKILVEISVLIRWNSLTLNEIAGEFSENNTLSEFEFIKNLIKNCEDKYSFPESWEKSVLTDKSFCSEEKKILLEVGAALGTTDKDGQLSTLELYSMRLKKLIEEEEEKYKVKGKMYRSLGVTAGAMIGIIII